MHSDTYLSAAEKVYKLSGSDQDRSYRDLMTMYHYRKSIEDGINIASDKRKQYNKIVKNFPEYKRIINWRRFIKLDYKSKYYHYLEVFNTIKDELTDTEKAIFGNITLERNDFEFFLSVFNSLNDPTRKNNRTLRFVTINKGNEWFETVLNNKEVRSNIDIECLKEIIYELEDSRRLEILLNHYNGTIEELRKVYRVNKGWINHSVRNYLDEYLDEPKKEDILKEVKKNYNFLTPRGMGFEVSPLTKSFHPKLKDHILVNHYGGVNSKDWLDYIADKKSFAYIGFSEDIPHPMKNRHRHETSNLWYYVRLRNINTGKVIDLPSYFFREKVEVFYQKCREYIDSGRGMEHYKLNQLRNKVYGQ